MKTLHQRCVLAVSMIGMVMLTGCTHLGPRTVTVDRFDYSTAIADSWKEQTLLNIVKIRYTDLPVFVEVASIVAGYSLQTGVSVNGVLSSEHAVQGNYGAIGGQAIYTDRPTITYVPMTGDKFLHGLITPIDPRNIFFMLQAGYPADFVLGLSVESLNGVRNRMAAGGIVRPADPEFVRTLKLLREAQMAGGFGMRVEEDKAKGSTAVLLFRRDDLPSDVAEKLAEIRRLLKLPADQQRFVLLYSPMRGAENELAVNSRSMLQILQAFASYVEVPEEHLQAGLVTPAFENESPAQRDIGRIRSGPHKPEGAYAAVQYRGYWFWVDDSDRLAKRALSAVMFFFTLAENWQRREAAADHDSGDSSCLFVAWRVIAARQQAHRCAGARYGASPINIQSVTSPMTASNMATVTLRGHRLRTGASLRRSRRSVDQCENPTSTVATILGTTRATPNRMAFSWI